MNFKEEVKRYTNIYGEKEYTKGSGKKTLKVKVYRTDGLINYKGSEKRVPRQAVAFSDYKKLASKKNIKARAKVYSTDGVAFVKGNEVSIPTKIVSLSDYNNL